MVVKTREQKYRGSNSPVVNKTLLNAVLANSIPVLLGAGLGLTSLAAQAQELEVPPGFERLDSGEIRVSDPFTAVAPKGYEINKEGVLVKEKVETKKPKEPMIIPTGFHRMPNGDIMANNPAKAKAPEGYRLTANGILVPLDEAETSKQAAVEAIASVDEPAEIPPGFHRMPDGTLMANNPGKAKAPPGYHLMPDGTLMADGSSVDHSRHSHGGGGMLMFEYRFERMYMEDFLDTTDELSPQDLITTPYGALGDGYAMTGTDMTMDMHMFMLMYHTTKYMVMVMAHYMEMEMGMLSKDDLSTSVMEVAGIADTVVTFEAPFGDSFNYTLGVSLPTGSIDEHGIMEHTANPVDHRDEHYPYAMQLGSGTYDAIFGLGYEHSGSDMTWGLDWQYTLRNGTNDNDYTLGDKLMLSAWSNWTLTQTISSKVELEYLEVGEIEGEDSKAGTNFQPGIAIMSSAYDPENYGGRRMDLNLGVKWENQQMSSIGFNFAVPVYQNLQGPQMKTQWVAGISLGYMF